jgi:hypothetical protein
MFFLSLLTRPFRLIGLLITVGLVAGGYWAWQKIHSSTPVSDAQALAAFRTEGTRTPGGAGIPRAGVYSYRVTGSERASAGPLAVDRKLPSRAQVIVRRVPGGYVSEMHLSDEHLEAFTYRVDTSGTRLTDTRVNLTFLGFGRDDRRRLQPAPLHLPAALAVGKSWRGAYKAGSLAVGVTSKVLRTANVTVGGRAVRTFVVSIRSTTTGAHPGTRVETLWWSPSLALPVRMKIDQDIGGIVGLKATADITLESTAPRT